MRMRRRQRSPRIADEVRFHRDSLIADYLASGHTPEEARRRAFVELGNVGAIEEEVRDVRGRWLADLASDLRYALRTLRRAPAFAAVAILSLALGIGANSAIFTIVNAVMLRPLPVAAPHELVQFARVRGDGRPGAMSYPLFTHFRDNVRSISGAFAQWSSEQAVSIDGEDELLMTAAVTGDYFRVLGVGASAGRLLTAADEVSVPTAAVISDRYWQRRFGRDPSALGKSLRIRTHVYTIVGVAAASFTGVRPDVRSDVIVPLLMTESQRRESTFNVLSVLGRLRDGATVEQANAEVQVLWSARLQETARGLPEKARAEALRARAAALPAPDGINPLRDDFSAPLLILLGLVSLVLLLVCVNLSGLLLARAAARQHEIAIRLAIGASRTRLIRQLLTESLVMAAIGGTIGLSLSGWLGGRLVSLFSNGNPLALDVAPDWRVLAFTSIVSLAACVLAGLVPAVQAVRGSLNAPLKTVRAPGASRTGMVLVATQLAISMILVVGATMFVTSLLRLYGVERGFDGDPVLLAAVRHDRTYTPEQTLLVQAAIVERLRALPGVENASAAQVLPLAGGLWNRDVAVEGYTFRSDESESVGFNAIAPAYFATIGTPVVAGREFDPRDGAEAPVAIVNEAFARYFFGDASPLGRRVRSLDVAYTIVGVVRDAKYQSLRHGIIKTMYVPWTLRTDDQPLRYSYLLRLEAADPAAVVALLDRVLRDADPGLRLRNVISYATLVDRSLVAERLMATLGGFFGALALLIAALGVFGVLAFQVARRTSEFGLRTALGADRPALMRLVLRDVAVMVTAGVTIGGALSLMVTGLARRIVFDVAPNDPLVFATAAAVLGGAALLAAWLPARRAARVDPLIALRHE
jgi:predicted permease